MTVETHHLSMLFLGLLGTGHCLGMCGPLVLALPARTGKLSAQLLYHLGRITTYTAVGALLGGLGQVATAATGSLTRVVQIQIALAGIAAVFMAVLGLARLGLIREPALLSAANPARIPGFRWLMGRDARSDSSLLQLPLGMVLGLLPCGLSFAAFARALPAGSALDGAALVLAFGLGTLPGLLLLGTLASQAARRYRTISDLLAGVLLIGMAASLLGDVLARV